MGFMDRLMGRTPAKAQAAQPAQPARKPAGPAGPAAAAPSTQAGANSPQNVRKEMVRVSTRDTLTHNGIPAHWIRAEPLTTATPGREPGVHVRLVVLHWDPRLMHHAVALQDHLEKRLLALDPTADQWLMGVSWQFSLADMSDCPPLPHPGSWTAHPAGQSAAPAEAASPAAQATPDGNADVISGPTRLQQQGRSSPDARQALERMLSERDDDFRKQSDDDDGFGKTQPMGFDKTQPMGFEKTEPAQFEKTQAFQVPVKRE